MRALSVVIRLPPHAGFIYRAPGSRREQRPRDSPRVPRVPAARLPSVLLGSERVVLAPANQVAVIAAARKQAVLHDIASPVSVRPQPQLQLRPDRREIGHSRGNRSSDQIAPERTDARADQGSAQSTDRSAERADRRADLGAAPSPDPGTDPGAHRAADHTG